MPMNDRTDADQKRDLVLNQTLRGLPLRKAPLSLEARVLNELARRAAMPWWRASFSGWPVAARVGFVLACAGLIAATILGGVSAVIGDRPVSEASAMVIAWISPILTLISSV